MVNRNGGITKFYAVPELCQESNGDPGIHRVDPENCDVTAYTGLVGAYTYSDMTGYALSVVGGFPPQG